jgi:DNA repair protein RecO (recombination protein O)
MEQWQDQAIILAARPHGENGAVVSLLTRGHGRQSGYMRGAFSTKNRASLQIGNTVDAHWQSRVEGGLGSLNLELSRCAAARIMQDALKLAALQSACALCDEALPEKEGYPGLYHGFEALLQILESDVWAQAYVMWEIALLRELGFSLDLTQCAGGGDSASLAYVSPKTGRAVSAEMGAPYRDKLLLLPPFLSGNQHHNEADEIALGLSLTGYFLEHWAFAHHTRGVPEARLRLQERYRNSFT